MSESTVCLNVRSQVENVISELQGVHELMLSSDLDPAVLANFRDSLNRVRNTAWAAQLSNGGCSGVGLRPSDCSAYRPEGNSRKSLRRPCRVE